MDSLKKTARKAGLLYLLLAISGMLGLMTVPKQIIVTDDIQATVQNIMNKEWLYRVGIFSNLVCQTLYIFLVLQLGYLFENVNPRLTELMKVLVIVAVPIAFLNTVNQIAPLVLLYEVDFASVFEVHQINTFVHFFLRLYQKGIVVVEVFWGLWLFPFGLLVYQSGFIPRILGVFLIIGCFGYLFGTTSSILFPDYKYLVAPFTSISGAVSEFSIILWLLIKGVNEKQKEVTIAK